MNAEPNHAPEPNDADAQWIERAIAVCEAARAGDLEQRLVNVDCDGRLAALMHAINGVLDLSDAFVREATASLDHAARGRFYRRVLPNGMGGSYRRAARSINDATAAMDAKTKELAAEEAKRRRMADEFVDVVGKLAASSAEIGSFSKVIEGVARQTRLLALNATIEAARVGEAGRGFAVVAGEVKRMAQETADATRRIEAQIAEIRQSSDAVTAAIERMRDTSGDVAAAPRLAA